MTLPTRNPLPKDHRTITHKFKIENHEGYLTVGLYPDGKPGEIFITIAKEGSVVGGLSDSFATTVSMLLQIGVPLRELCDKFRGEQYEPSGNTSNPEIPYAKSITDYVFRWLELKFLSFDDKAPKS